jgi:hypothetical protein
MRCAKLATVALCAAAIEIGCASAAEAPHTLDIINRVPKFENFYREAAAVSSSEANRWALWKKDYGIASVPPTPEGDALARKQLDDVFPRYAALMPQLDADEARAEATGRGLFARINTLYGTAGIPVHSALVLFVGQFDGNEFTIPAMNGKPPTVVMPVENPDLELDMAHEISHSIHFQLAGVKNGFGAPIGETMFLEGLAMHSTKAIVPGLPDARYTELQSEPGWFARCTAHKTEIVRGILAYLDQAGADVATKFTFGKGTTGMDRELYCAGWFAVGKMIDDGATLAKLASVPESGMIDAVRRALTRG